MTWHLDGGEGAPLLAPELRARVRQIQIRTHRLVDAALAGGYRSTFRGQGIEFEEVRPYQPGDEVRSIDWKVTARVGEPFIKSYAEERELTLQLLVDTSRSMDFGSRRLTKRELAAQFAALIAFVAIRHQDRVGLDLFGEEPGLHLPARKGSQHVLRLVREVLAAEPTTGGSGFEALMQEQERILKRRSLVFVVSDFLDHEGQPEFARSLARIARRHDVIAVRVGDPLEEALPPVGIFSLRSLEDGRRMELDARSARVRERWTEAARQRRESLDALLTAARVESIELRTDRDVADPVVEFFRRRSQGSGAAR